MWRESGPRQISKLAQEETQILLNTGQKTNINEELKKLPDTSLEAIKGKRRPVTYKNMVQDILGSFAPGPSRKSSTSSSLNTKSIIQDQQALPDESRTTSTDPENYSLLEDTEIYVPCDISPHAEFGSAHPGELTEEMANLDEALLNLNDKQKCKNTTFSQLLSKKMLWRRGQRKEVLLNRKKLLKRKLKRIRYTKFQRMFAKNRKKAFKVFITIIAFTIAWIQAMKCNQVMKIPINAHSHKWTRSDYLALPRYACRVLIRSTHIQKKWHGSVRRASQRLALMACRCMIPGGFVTVPKLSFSVSFWCYTGSLNFWSIAIQFLFLRKIIL